VKIAVVTGICVERDAISAAAAGQAELLQEIPEVSDVTLISQYSNRPTAVRQVVVTNAWDLISDPHVAATDMIIFHWGIRYGLFDALPVVANGRATAVYFQNLTPAALAGSIAESVVHSSLLQIQLPQLTHSAMWSPSEFNLETLRQWGFDEDRLRFVPFPIERPAHLPRHSPDEKLRLLAVGRFVPAKGVHILVEAIATVVEHLGSDLSVVLAGSTDLSDTGYLDHLRDEVTRLGLDEIVEFRLNVDDEQLWEEYERAHVFVSPSLHEGLCVPVIEAYLAGCRVVATDAGNLPNLVHPPDPVVAAGDARALAEALVSVLRSARQDRPTPPLVDQLLATYSRRTAIETLREAVLDELGSE
jgi:glycosyltransferase involved in cell wall biosynthesis